MKKLILNILFVILIFSFTTSYTYINNTVSKNKCTLFVIERSKDANEIIYDININVKGKINKEKPVNVYWIKRTKSNKIEPLTWIQRKFAHGLKFLSIEENETRFQFVSYNKRDFILKKNKSGDYYVYTNYKSKKVIVNRIYIQIEGGTFWVPNVTEVKLHATDIKTGEEIVEIVKP